jgi:adenylate cyclase
MQAAMADVNAFNRNEGLPEVQMGIAVNTGPVIVGNIGSITRAKYGVVGTHVNLTGRIEGFTVGGQVIVSHATVEKAGPIVRLGPSSTFEAKGFRDPITVHELLGVGGRWNASLPERKDTLDPLRPEIAVSISLLEGKQMTDAVYEGALVEASLVAAKVRTGGPLPPFGNLRMRRVVDGKVQPGDMYAKVASGPEGGAYFVRFTSMDPEAAEAIRQALKRP